MPGTRRRGTGKLDPMLSRALARLKETIEEQGLTQEQVASASGLTQGHVSRILAADSPETAFWVVARIARGLGMSLDWLVQDPPRPQPADATPSSPPSIAPSSASGRR